VPDSAVVTLYRERTLLRGVVLSPRDRLGVTFPLIATENPYINFAYPVPHLSESKCVAPPTDKIRNTFSVPVDGDPYPAIIFFRPT